MKENDKEAMKGPEEGDPEKASPEKASPEEASPEEASPEEPICRPSITDLPSPNHQLG